MHINLCFWQHGLLIDLVTPPNRGFFARPDFYTRPDQPGISLVQWYLSGNAPVWEKHWLFVTMDESLEVKSL